MCFALFDPLFAVVTLSTGHNQILTLYRTPLPASTGQATPRRSLRRSPEALGVKISQQSPQAQTRGKDVWDRNGRHRRLVPATDCEELRQKATDSKTGYGGDSGRADGHNRNTDEEHRFLPLHSGRFRWHGGPVYPAATSGSREPSAGVLRFSPPKTNKNCTFIRPTNRG
jgi:hypothetical protein